jgi:hypothetical protein
VGRQQIGAAIPLYGSLMKICLNKQSFNSCFKDNLNVFIKKATHAKLI